MSRDLYIWGSGGFGREAADVVQACGATGEDGWMIAGVYDDAPSDVNLERLQARGIPFLGSFPPAPPAQGAALVVAIGAPSVRARLVERARADGWTFPTVVHPDAVLGTRSTLGEGTVVCAGVQISTNVRLGAHVHVNPNATIGHDAVLEDCVSVNPAAVVSGEVTVRTRTLIGAAATVLQGLTVGSGSTVGAMACVTRDLPDEVTVKGVPAR